MREAHRRDDRAVLDIHDDRRPGPPRFDELFQHTLGVRVDGERNLLFVKGGVPGARDGYVLISK